MRLVERLHASFVQGRRVRLLAEQLAPLMPKNGSVLDLGCGDGTLAATIKSLRPDITVTGLETLARESCHIDVEQFDGYSVPRGNDSMDTVLLVDVLHHADDPRRLLSEALRVARQSVVIKDHNRNGLFAKATLRLMDRIGNARYGVALPHNYWSRKEWIAAFETLECQATTYQSRPNLYPWPASTIFGRSLHFIAELSALGHRADCSVDVLTRGDTQ